MTRATRVSNFYGLTNVPSIFLIGADGIVKVTSIGFDKANLENISSELAGDHEASIGRIVPCRRSGAEL